MSSGKRVLVAMDFSDCAAAALRRAARIAEWTGASLEAVHVVTPIWATPIDPAFPLPAPLAAISDQDLVAGASARWPEFARGAGLSVAPALHVEVGVPRDCLLDAARRWQPEFLVVGAHGVTDARRGIGPTASACAQWAAAQTLIVRADQHGPFRRIVVGIDFSETSLDALEQAVAFAVQEGAELCVFHAYPSPWGRHLPTEEMKRNMPQFDAEYARCVQRRLEEFCAPLRHELGAAGATYHVQESSGHAEALKAFVQRHACDLVVLGTRGRANARDFFWGSTAERVVREASCSVLAVKPRAYLERFGTKSQAEAGERARQNVVVSSGLRLESVAPITTDNSAKDSKNPCGGCECRRRAAARASANRLGLAS